MKHLPLRAGALALLLLMCGCAKKPEPPTILEEVSRPAAATPSPQSGDYVDPIRDALEGFIADNTPAPETPEPTLAPTLAPAPAELRGNTTGNIVNGGVVAFDGENFMALNTLDASSVNLYKGYAYYVNQKDEGRLYRQALDGTPAERLSLATDVAYVNVVDDMIFYRSTGDKYSVHRMNLDGSEDVKLTSMRASRLAAVEGYLYYANWDGDTTGLWRMDYDGGGQVCLYPGDIPLFINVCDGAVWWISYERDGCLARTDPTGDTVFYEDVKKAECLNVYGERLYFVVNAGERNQCGLFSLASNFTDLRHLYIARGLQNLNIADDTVYFRTGADTEAVNDDLLFSCTLGGGNVLAVS